LRAFGELKERSKAALPALAKFADSDKESTMLLASAAAGMAGGGSLQQSPFAEQNVQRCAQLLRKPWGRLDGLALQALAAYGGKAAPAIPAIIDWYLRRIEQAKGAPKEEQEEAAMPGLYIAGLVCSMREAAFAQLDGNNQPAAEAADLLCLIGRKAVSAVRPILRSSLRADRGNNGSHLLQALKKMGPAAVPELVAAMRDADPKMRRAACDVLYFMGADARDALPALEKVAAQDESKEVRLGASVAVEEINRASNRRRAPVPQAPAR